MTDGDLFSRLRVRRDDIAAAMGEAIVAQVPGYARWFEARNAHILDETHLAVSRALDLCPDDAPSTESDLEHCAAVAQDRAQSPLSVMDLQTGFQVSYHAVLQYCMALARSAGDHGDLMRLNVWGAREVPRALQAATTAFTAARRHIGDSEPARQVLAERLVQGIAVDAAAAAAGVKLPQGYQVLLCQMRRPLDVADSQAQLTSVEHVLKSVPGALWLGRLDRSRLLILLPTGDDAASGQSVAAGLTAAIAEIVDQVVYTAQASGDVAAVPEAVKEAQQAIVLVAAMPDVECRPYRMEELLVELAVMRQPTVRQGLADLLAPLSNGTDLLHTLEVLFSCGFDRKKSAEALHIHRRTLTYRLGRVREITGIDPASAHGMQLLRIALTARRLPAADVPENRQGFNVLTVPKG